MDKKRKKKFRWQEPLIALLITLAMLGAVMGAICWYTGTMHVELDARAMWTGNAVGGLIMFFIVYHFIRRPDDSRDS